MFCVELRSDLDRYLLLLSQIMRILVERSLLKTNYTTMRLRALKELKEKHHENYQNIFQMGKKGQDDVIDALISEYIPNVLHDLPSLIDIIEKQNEYIQEVKEEIVDVTKQRDRAYKKLGWTINKFVDNGEMYDYL